MKYANLWWPHGEDVQETNGMINIGDVLQFLTIDYLYERFGIDRNEIIRLRVDEISTYKGDEMLVLPLNWCVFDPSYMEGDRLNISSKIKPVFLAMTLGTRHKDSYFNAYNIRYLQEHSPIGCRDEITLETLKHYGIEAYLNGCFTAVLPCGQSKERNKVYLVDAPLELKDYLPKSILENAEYRTQQYYYNKKEINAQEIVERIKEQYSEYERNAVLVITSRLHVASPCMAMGIPVIFVKRKIDERFAWIDKLLSLYSYNEIEKINWSPSIVEYEDMKKCIIDNAYKRVVESKVDTQCMRIINNFWTNRSKRTYSDVREVLFYDYQDIKEFMKLHWNRQEMIQYSIWGINKGVEELIVYIEKQWPNAELKHIVDTYKTLHFREKVSIKPNEWDIGASEYVFVLSVGASNMAIRKFEKNGMSKDRYYIVGDLYITDGKCHKLI